MIHATQIHSSNQKLLEYLAGWQRARAELDNLKKRQYEEQQATRERLTQEIVQSLLGLADNFHAMTDHVPEDMKNHAWTEGVIHIARQMDQVLEEYGVTTIADTNLKFDPNIHEAVTAQGKSKRDGGQVVKILQVGYKMGDQVIRPAKVKVAK